MVAVFFRDHAVLLASGGLPPAAARVQKAALPVDSHSTDAVADDEYNEAAQDRAEDYKCRPTARDH